MLVVGIALPVILIQPAAARDDAPRVLAQQDGGKDQKQQQRQQNPQQQEQRQPQGQQQRQQNRQQRQEQQQQRQQQRQQDRQGQQEQREQQRQQQRREQQERQQNRQQDRRDQQQQQQKDRQDRQQQRQQERQDEQQRQQKQRQDQQKQRREDNRQPEPRGDRRQEERRDDRPDIRPERREERRDSRQERREERRDDRARKLEDVRGERRERREGTRTVIQEGNRTIVRDGNRTFIRRDESDRFRRVGRDVNVQRVGGETRTVVVGPNGARIVTVTDANGRLIRRSRFVDGREVIIIDNRPRGGRRADAFFVVLPALAIGALAIPRERYIVEAETAPPEYIYGALTAPPVERLPRAYTLDEIRYSPEVRDRMPRIDLDTITFDLGSWEIAPDQYDRLAPIADGIRRAIAQNPDEVFLLEGHTDATGNDEDNLSLSDRRAEAVSIILTDQFQIPPENLTTQGYGSQQPKISSPGPERANRRVTIRRITPLLQQGHISGAPAPQ